MAPLPHTRITVYENYRDKMHLRLARNPELGRVVEQYDQILRGSKQGKGAAAARVWGQPQQDGSDSLAVATAATTTGGSMPRKFQRWRQDFPPAAAQKLLCHHEGRAHIPQPFHLTQSQIQPIRPPPNRGTVLTPRQARGQRARYLVKAITKEETMRVVLCQGPRRNELFLPIMTVYKPGDTKHEGGRVCTTGRKSCG